MGIQAGEIDAMVRQLGGSPLAAATFARTALMRKGELERARALCARALALAPHDAEVRAIHAEVFGSGAGDWFFTMVRDQRRNSAYGRAIGRAAAAGGLVLDIGTGTGLFAMMAAKAGADQVVSCERNSAVAEAARATFERNGFGDRIRLLVKDSTELEVGRDLEARADILIWDNTGSDLIGLGTLPVLEDAFARLVKPEAVVIPAGCAIRAALAHFSSLPLLRMGLVEGFDLTAFNVLASPVYPLAHGDKHIEVRSAAATVFEFDFRKDRRFQPQRTTVQVMGAGGPANGLVQWLEFLVDEHVPYSAAPDAPFSAFTLNFRAADAPFAANAGQTFTIAGSHDREHFRLWLPDQ